MLGLPLENSIKIERVHKIRKLPYLSKEVPRDIIMRFQNYEDKAEIWEKLRGMTTLEFG